MHETLIKRTIWVAKCPQCDESIERTENPPRERRCLSCEVWVPYVEQSYIGPDLK